MMHTKSTRSSAASKLMNTFGRFMVVFSTVGFKFHKEALRGPKRTSNSHIFNRYFHQLIVYRQKIDTSLRIKHFFEAQTKKLIS